MDREQIKKMKEVLTTERVKVKTAWSEAMQREDYNAARKLNRIDLMMNILCIDVEEAISLDENKGE